MMGFSVRVFFLFLLALSGCTHVKTLQSPAPVYEYGLLNGAGSSGAHTVMPGDTLADIAQRYRLNLQDIVYVNSLQAPYGLAAGQRLILPPPQTYIVRAGDTLYGISRLFNVSTTELARLNDLQKPYAVAQGASLRMPPVRPLPRRMIDGVRDVMEDGAFEASVEGVAAPVPLVRPEILEDARLKTPARSSDKFIWPVNGPVVSSFGPKKGGLHNDGINIKAPKGAPVRAAENGTVAYADNRLKGFGNLVLVRHADGWMTAYAHMDKLMVRRGDTLRRGQTVGTVGRTGSVDSPQLHFEVRKGTEALDPEHWLMRQGS